MNKYYVVIFDLRGRPRFAHMSNTGEISVEYIIQSMSYVRAADTLNKCLKRGLNAMMREF